MSARRFFFFWGGGGHERSCFYFSLEVIAHLLPIFLLASCKLSKSALLKQSEWIKRKTIFLRVAIVSPVVSTFL